MKDKNRYARGTCFHGFELYFKNVNGDKQDSCTYIIYAKLCPIWTEYIQEKILFGEHNKS